MDNENTNGDYRRQVLKAPSAWTGRLPQEKQDLF